MIEAFINEVEENVENKYPYIGIYKADRDTSSIVLFTKQNCGIQLDFEGEDDPEYPTRIGEYVENYDESLFKPYSGSITIRNSND